jgi:hypothetical protein
MCGMPVDSAPYRRRVAPAVLILCLLATGCRSASQRNLLVVVQDGKYGYIDHVGRVVIKPQFFWADDFWRGLGTVYVCGRYVSIDAAGALHPLRLTVEGRLEPFRRDTKFGFVDASGEFKIAPVFEKALPFSEGLAAVQKGAKWGFVDQAGKIVIQPQFEAAFYFFDGVAQIEDQSGFVLIDRSGRVVARGYEFPGLTREGRTLAGRDGKWGFLDAQGTVAIALKFDAVSQFSGGLAAIKVGRLWGYVDRDGALIIPAKFDQAGEFSSGLAPATLAGKTGFIDKSGNIAFYLDYEYAPGFLAGDEESNLFVAPSDVSRFFTRDERSGYLNTAGQVIWGPAKDTPDHPPLMGWSEEDVVDSCKGFPESTKRLVEGFPKR